MKNASTKLKGDIAEHRVISELLLREKEVLLPLGDRLPYDIAIAQSGKLTRIQVKMAWFSAKDTAYLVDIRRSQTNRKHYKYTKYKKTDFDYLIAWLPNIDIFYIFPSHFACSYAGGIYMSETQKQKRPKKPRSAEYRNAWHLLP